MLNFHINKLTKYFLMLGLAALTLSAVLFILIKLKLSSTRLPSLSSQPSSQLTADQQQTQKHYDSLISSSINKSLSAHPLIKDFPIDTPKYLITYHPNDNLIIIGIKTTDQNQDKDSLINQLQPEVYQLLKSKNIDPNSLQTQWLLIRPLNTSAVKGATIDTTSSDSAQTCISGGGIWDTKPDGIGNADHCGIDSKDVVSGPGCLCPKGVCWNGAACVPVSP